MAVPSFFEDIKAYVGFSLEDSTRLREFGERKHSELPAIADVFYDRMLSHPGALAVFADRAQVHRLKISLVGWLRTGLAGPHDEAFYEGRLVIGRRHVQINLPQQYMFTAMDVVRLELRRLVESEHAERSSVQSQLNDAIDRWLDLELAIMLQSYREESDVLLSRRERLAGIGQVAGTIGHELRNPLGVIESSLFLVRRRLGADERVDRHLDRIGEQVRSANAIITDLLEMVRDQPPKWERVDLHGLVARCLQDLEVPSGQSVEVRVPDGTEVRADPGLLSRALANLLRNGLQAMDGKPGTIVVAVAQDEENTTLSVADEGPGFDAAILKNAFQPLVTSRAQGIGLGLALVQRVADRHQGHARAENRAEGGAVVSIHLPRGLEEAPEPALDE